jgi:hypothetical protein
MKPSDEMLQELQLPKPPANKAIFIKIDSSNKEQDKVFKKFKTNSIGQFTL